LAKINPKIKHSPTLYVLASLGVCFIIMVLTSAYIEPRKVTVIEEKLVYVDKIEYKNVNVFISGININRFVDVYRMNYPQEYEKILKFYDRYTYDRRISTAIIENCLDLSYPINRGFGLAQRESKFNPMEESKNPNGTWDRGLFQLNSGSRKKWKRSDFFDIQKNTFEAITCIKWLDKTMNNSDLALAAYNAGYTAVNEKKYIPYTSSLHVFEIKNNERDFDIAFNTQLIPSLNFVRFEEGQIQLTVSK